MARITMTQLIRRIRELTSVSAEEYSIGDVVYWSDDQLQMLLDEHRMDVFGEYLTPQGQRQSGAIIYRAYRSTSANWEASQGGTARAVVRDNNGDIVSGSLYSFDSAAGLITFTLDQAAATRTLEGQVYDLYGAAADLCTRWAAYLTRQFDFKAGINSFSASQQAAALMTQAAQYRRMATNASSAGSNGMSGSYDRSDTIMPMPDSEYLRYHRSTRG